MENKYKYDVFLSFSSKDLDFVKPIWEKLTKKGLKVFFSDEVLKKSIGLDFDDEIETALEQSNHFVLVCTPNAMASGWVKDEYKTFYHQLYKKSRKQRRFIILAGPGFDISLVPLFMRQLQMAKSIDELIETIPDKTMPQKAGEKELICQKPEVPLNRKRNPLKNKIIKWSGITMAVAILIILVFQIIQTQKSPGSKPPKTKPPPGQKIYVTHLSFIAPETFPNNIQPDLAESINKAVVKGMNMGAESNPKLEINALDHEIPNSDSNAQKLMDIFFDPGLKTIENVKIERIIKEIMNPHHVDVIVFCYCFNDAVTLLTKFRSRIIIKSQRQIVTRNLQFNESELVCEVPISKKKILCKIAYEQIAKDVKYLLEKL